MASLLSRRDLLLIGVASAIAAVGASGFPSSLFAQSSVTVDQFLALSEKLTETKDLDADIAKTLLGGFLATGHGADLAQLVKDDAEYTSYTELANAIVAAWFSGMYDSGSGQAVRDLHGRAGVGRADLHQALGGSAAATPATGAIRRRVDFEGGRDGRRRDRRRCNRRLWRIRRDRGGEACGRRREGCDPGGRREGRSPNGGRELLERSDQGAGMPLPAGAAGHAPDLERSRLLVQSGRSGQVRLDLHQGRRRNDMALARHLPAAAAQRLSPEDGLRSGLDWPISYDDIEPFYGEAESEIGVAGDSASDLGAPRSTPYPMPEIPQTYLDKAYFKALEGTVYEVRSTPEGRNSVGRDNRPACCGNASCIPVCPIQAKYDATVHVDRAVAAGAPSTKKPQRSSWKSAPTGTSAAIRFKRWDGSEGRATARCSFSPPMRSKRRACCLTRPAMRRPTALPTRPTRWAATSWTTRHSFRGRCPATRSIPIAGRYRPRASRTCATAISARPAAPFASRSAMTAGRGRPARQSPPRGHWRARQSGARALANALRNQAARHIRLASLVEQPPDPDNRVTLDPDAKDIYGVPQPRIFYRLDDYTKAGFAASVKAHDEIFAKLGATEIHHSPDSGRGAHHRHGADGRRPELVGGRREPPQPRPSEPFHSRLDGLPDIGNGQSDAYHRRARHPRGRYGQGRHRRLRNHH